MTDTIMAFGLMQEYDQMETSITGNQDRKGFHALMMDLRKAYDSYEFWATELGCRSLGVPEEIIQFFRAKEERMQTRVRTAYGLTEPINIKRGMLQGDSASPARFLAFMNPVLVIMNKHGQGIRSPTGGKIAAVCAVDDTILYAKNQRDMQETTGMYVDWLNFVKMETNIEKCIHIRSLPKKRISEALEKQIERVQWEAKKQYRETIGEALEETGWEPIEEGTNRTQIINQIYAIKGKKETECTIKEMEDQKELENYIKWWKEEPKNEESEDNILKKLEQTAEVFNLEWINIKRSQKGWEMEINKTRQKN